MERGSGGKPFYRKVFPQKNGGIDIKDLREILKQGALELGVSLSDDGVERFMTYLYELKTWNRKMNLTSITSDPEIITGHFLDSLTPFKAIKDRKKLLDIGSGAGFPGIPLKMVMPELSVTLMDSTEKKVFFMRHIIRTLGLGDEIRALQGRAEDGELVEKYGACFDCVISRAFTGLKDFLSAALPYVRIDGIIMAMKGPRVVWELEGAQSIEGLEFSGLQEAAVPFTDKKTILVLYRRVS